MAKRKITSFDAENAGVFGDVLTAPLKKDKTVAGVLGLGYFEYWRMYPALEKQVETDLKNAVRRLEKALSGCKVVYPGMIDTLDRAEEAGKILAEAGAEIVVVIAGTYLPDFITMQALNRIGGRPEVILFSTQTGNDVNPKDNYVATMRNSALIAITQLSGSFRKMKLEYETVVGEISDAEAYREIAGKVAAHSAVKRLRRSTYGLVGHVFRGMYDLEFDRARVKGFLGPEVMTIQAEHLVELWKNIPDSETDAVSKKLLNRFAVKNVEPEDVKRSVRLGLAMRSLYRKYNLDGLCFLGQHYLEKMTGAPARMGASLLIEEDGFPVCCEGDIGGLVMCDLMKQFTGRPAFQAEWGQFDLKNNAVFLLGHGIGVPSLAKTEQAVRLTSSPEEWGFKGSGLNYELILKPGEVTMGHFLNAGDSYRMLVSHGESIDFPCLPCDELHAMIRVEKPVRQYLKEIIDTGSAHHIVVVHGNAVETLEKTAELMRIECVKI
ncbi:MAG: L-arabinose isomerase [Lentisphaerae bacterium ADurb.Bin242]|nr:MAG: L-arabinose isomerase [Lentisphaerae bacterium ADurb.Bin242]